MPKVSLRRGSKGKGRPPVPVSATVRASWSQGHQGIVPGLEEGGAIQDQRGLTGPPSDSAGQKWGRGWGVFSICSSLG